MFHRKIYVRRKFSKREREYNCFQLLSKLSECIRSIMINRGKKHDFSLETSGDLGFLILATGVNDLVFEIRRWIGKGKS